MKKLKVYIRIPASADCGVGFYRMYSPLKKAADNGDIEMRCDTFTFGEKVDSNDTKPSDDDLRKNVEWANVIYWARNDVPQYIAQAGGCHWHKLQNKVYMPCVLDIDDNVQATRPFNPGYRSFHPNSPYMAWNLKGITTYNALTVSTENLREFYGKYKDKKNIYVCPNSVDMEERDKVYKADYSKSKLFKKKEGEIRIIWSGSASHWENLKHIEKPVLDIMHKYPNVTFYYTGLFGDLFQDAELIKQDRIKVVGFSKLRDYAKTLREHNADIALAPLTDNDFNRAKSNLRLLEYGSLHIPTICSPILPYRTFKDDEVMFAKEKEDWFDAMEKMVLDEKFRTEYSKKIYTRVKKDFDVNKNYKIWLKAFRDIIKKKPEGK